MKISTVQLLILTGISLAALCIPTVVAADVEVKLIEPRKFRDIDVTSKSLNKSIEDVHHSLSQLINQVAKEYLKDSNNLIIEVTQVDLAGYMEWTRNAREIRVVRNNDRYVLEFSYRLIDSTGKVLKEGNANIREFLHDSPSKKRLQDSHLVGYMRDDLEKWFKKEFNN
ncbi:DUF3016 domain-containing protein [Aliikangiella maris]|uniref:DUF3016 domain-containing protein n=2 Tax=Aliikangiella maris TaxID=3162458 RepID=A0ABV3MIP8_9GAMM